MIYFIACVTMFFFKLNNVSLNVCTSFCLSIHPSMGHWVSVIVNNATILGALSLKNLFVNSTHVYTMPQRWIHKQGVVGDVSVTIIKQICLNLNQILWENRLIVNFIIINYLQNFFCWKFGELESQYYTNL